MEMTHGRFGDHPNRLGGGLCRITLNLITPRAFKRERQDEKPSSAEH
jgi:hypothetical protein